MKLQKAYEISDARIQFVSLVDKAANKRQFLITKAEDGEAQFSAVGRIVKMEADTHYITGIVYEPLMEDSHGNYMTEDEIAKAAHWFVKNGVGIDTQHTFEVEDGAALVESYIAPCDMEIDSQVVLKGSWVMTVEVTDTGLWEKVQKGEITGFSMGGVGKYSKEDVALDTVSKAEDKKSIFKRLGAMLGFQVVEKGQMMEAYQESEKYSGFWNAFYTLEDILYRYNWSSDRYELEADESTIREALADFSTIITGLLTESTITKALTSGNPLLKSGKKISTANKKKLDDAYTILTELRSEFEEAEAEETIEKEEAELTKQEMQEMIDSSIEASVKKALEAAGVGEPAPIEEPVQEEEALTKEAVAAAVEDAVAKALAPIFKARGIASNLNEEHKPVEKSEQHYLAGIL